jgi:hypothetical protein
LAVLTVRYFGVAYQHRSVCFGSLAAIHDKFSPMAALERIAVIQVPDFKGKISTS